jgi:hypothetical protein
LEALNKQVDSGATSAFLQLENIKIKNVANVMIFFIK